MDSAIKLITNFITKTNEICDELNKFEHFDYSHSISATLDFHTIEVLKVDELVDLNGFFLASAQIISENINFTITYGDIDYGLFYTIYIDEKKYSYFSYTETLLKQNNFNSNAIRSIEQMDICLMQLKSTILKSYPLFLKKKKKYLMKMDNYMKKVIENEDTASTLQTATTLIRKANMLFIQMDYAHAYDIYKGQEAFLSRPEVVKMEHCKKYM